jgi:hypothetical protein
VPSEEPLDGEADLIAWTDERAERYERLRLGAEAMAGLKPQEIRCLLLKAEGLSYQEICEVTNFSYTKVNRCITEGRRAFLKRVASIESGAECERLSPLISKVADGEASADEMRTVRPHLKGCLACKATLREYRAAPSRIAGLVPPVVALAGGGGGTTGLLGRMLQAVQERFAGMGDAAGAKLAAVAASAAVIAGGGAAGIDALHHDPPAVAPSAYAAAAQAAKQATPAGGGSAAARSASGAPDPSIAAIVAVDATSAPGQAGAEPATKPATSAPEFDPGAAGEGGSGSAADPRPAEFASAPSAPIPAPSPSPDAVSGTPRAGSGTASGGPGTASGEFGP